MRPIFLALILSAALAPVAPAGDLRHFEDAALRAVQFVDREEGWAVGDEGVIWHSIDGGKTWERQPSGTRASLRSLHFLSPHLGWVVGREELPEGGSLGVLLYTQDGGLKWQRIHRNSMPGFNHVRFFDAKIGFVVGDGNDRFPTGIFMTTDSGRKWRPIPGPRSPGWMAAEFPDGKNGALVGNWNRLATLRDGALGSANVDTLGGRSLHGLHLKGDRAVAVGQGGAVLLSNTAGRDWGYADLKLPTEVRSAWDFHAVHCQGDQVWVVGRPGSALLHSADHGRTWDILKTGQSLPLNGVFFVDEQRGWAVGELGTMLGTQDGGKTWALQRRGGQRSAVLFVHSRQEGLPVDTVALLGGQEGYLTTALRVNAPDPASSLMARAADAQRWSMAVNKVGGSSGEMLWQFPLPQYLDRSDRRQLIKLWDRAQNDRAAEQFLRQLVLTLRTWKPAVVITDNPDPAAVGFAGDSLVAEAMHEAFSRAADPKVFPEQLETLGLETWQASKLYGLWDTNNGAHVSVDTSDISPRLESTLRDFAADASQLLTGSPMLPGMRYYRLLDSKIEGAANQRHLMEGVALAPGGSARRELAPLEATNPEMIRSIRTRRNLQVLAETPAGNLVDPDRLLAQLGPSLTNLPDDQGCAAAFAIASQYARSGQWTLAREVFLLMVDRYPAHPLAADAYRWLIRYNSSSEARRRHELGQFKVVSNLNVQVTPGGRQMKTRNATLKAEKDVEISREGKMALLGGLRETRLWNQGALEVGERLAAFGPLYMSDPSMHFCLNAARRNLGKFDEAQQWYLQFRNEMTDGPWREAASAELWLATRVGAPPRPVAGCRQTSNHPFLDGKFDDACWQGLKPIVLRNAVGDTNKDYPTEAWLAHDQDFLYVALRCQHPEGQRVPPVKGRTHDADLRQHDRVELMLDLDRDYSTYFRLQVDQRGCVCDDCSGDFSWNPRWFVAVHSDKTSWQIEAAIPLIELTGDHVTVGRAWACNVVRVLPGRGVQAMSAPADVHPRPEGMGLLMFMPEITQKSPMMHAN